MEAYSPSIITTELRYELKLLAHPQHYEGLGAFLRLHKLGFSKSYPARTINNIYFDTLELASYYENLAGQCTRRKLRYRWYGEGTTPQPGVLEIKAKHDLLGWKHFCPVRDPFYVPHLPWGELLRRLRGTVPKEARNWLAQTPQVVLLNRYRRDYYESRDGLLRVTFDRDLHYYDQRFSGLPNFSRVTKAEPALIIEFKCTQSGEKTAKRLLAEFPFPVSRYSKYTLGVGSLIS